MGKWYFTKENKKKGPVDKEELLDLIKQQIIKQDDLVWTQGIDNWMHVHSIPELSTNDKKDGSVKFDQKLTAKYFAGFWKRFLAFCIDYILLFLVLTIINMLYILIGGSSLIYRPIIGSLNFVGSAFILGHTFIAIPLTWLYYAFMESSKHQATLGKQVLNIKITDFDGNKIGFGRATGRFFGKFLSSIILGIGYLMAGFTRKKQALHDIIARCLVITE